MMWGPDGDDMLYTITQQAVYLDELMAGLWRADKGFLRDRAIHTLAQQLPDVLRPVVLRSSAFDLSPAVAVRGDDLVLRIPGAGNHRLELALGLDILVSVNFRFEVVTRASGAPTSTPTVQVRIDLPWYWEFVIGALGVITVGAVGVAAAALPAIIEEIVKTVLSNEFSSPQGLVARRLGLLSTLTFDHDAPYTPEQPELVRIDVPAAAPAVPETVLADRPLDWIDIVLVADNYPVQLDPAVPDEFQGHAAAIAAVLLGEDRIDNARLRAMRSVIRLWRLPLTGTLPRERIARSVVFEGRRSSTLGNLARLAETALHVRAQLGHHAQLVVVQRTEPMFRAISLGPVVLLPIRAGTVGGTAGSVLVHELGHALGKLADEYVLEPDDTYLGPEPAAINVSRVPPPASAKWNRWLNRLPASSSDPMYQVTPGGHLGAYEFGAGVFRPAAQCKMLQSTENRAFCPVCEEALAMGLLQALGLTLPPSPSVAAAPLTVRVEYLEPWRSEPHLYTVAAPLSTGQATTPIALAVAPARPDGVPAPTQVRIVVERSAVPDARVTLQRVPAPPQSGDVLEVESGAIVIVHVVPDAAAPLPPDVRATLHQSVVLVFDQPPDVSLAPPQALAQDPGVGAILAPVLDPATGKLSRTGVTLSATSGDQQGRVHDTEIVFVVERLGGATTEHALAAVGAGGGPRSLLLEGLADGRYRWRAHTRQPALGVVSAAVELPRAAGGHHFEIKPRQVPSGYTLPAPFGLSVLLADRWIVPGTLPDVELPWTPPEWILAIEDAVAPAPLPPTPAGVVARPLSLSAAIATMPAIAASKRETFARYVKVACVAVAYHPEGKPLDFVFELAEVADPFSGAGAIVLDNRLPLSPYVSLAVYASLSLDDPRIGPGLTGLDRRPFKFRVRVRDHEGRESPWTEHVSP